jgi:hypothetical protein
MTQYLKMRNKDEKILMRNFALFLLVLAIHRSTATQWDALDSVLESQNSTELSPPIPSDLVSAIQRAQESIKHALAMEVEALLERLPEIIVPVKPTSNFTEARPTPKWDKGDKGDKGDKWDKGDKGNKGNKGYKGDKGYK